MLYRRSQAHYTVATLLTSSAEVYTLMRDDIQPEGLMIYTARCAAMICQVCDLDKKKPHPVRMRFFLVETSGLEPLTPCMSSKYSSQLSYASELLPDDFNIKAECCQ